jgi:tetratricopeptide (TPR) repeat protein
MKKLIYYLLIIALLILSCAPSTKSFEELPPQVLLAKSDSLIKVYPDKPELVNAIINARLHLAEKNNDFSQYHEVLKIEPNNPMAQYYILMNTGKQYHEKEYKNGQWEAIQSFSKASAIIDSLGEPHFWIGKAYEKKDEMDFELALEAYDKSLELYLPKKLRNKVLVRREALLNRKKTYEDFWK